MSEPRRLAIIGGGASAALLLLYLTRHKKASGMQVDIFDRTSRFFRGTAYTTDYALHRLNVRAANMSAFADAPGDFAQWAERFQYAPEDFAARNIYAKYLEDRLRENVTDMHIRLISEDVLTCRRTNDELYALSGTTLHYAYPAVVLASGNVRLLQPEVAPDASGYFPEPWGMDVFQGLDGADKTIALLGSGLSAVDAIASLKTHDYQGKIIVISRNGWFPRAHAAPSKYTPFLSESDLALPPSQLMHKIRAEIARAAASGTPWQAVIDALRSVTNPIWQGWSADMRSVFLRRALTAWNVHRHRMAPENAEMIEHYISEGRLEIVRDKIIRVEGQGRVVCRNGVISADRVINCLGYRYDEGRDFEVSYKIGPARFGELFETTAIPEIRTQAAEIAARLMS